MHTKYRHVLFRFWARVPIYSRLLVACGGTISPEGSTMSHAHPEHSQVMSLVSKFQSTLCAIHCEIDRPKDPPAPAALSPKSCGILQAPKFGNLYSVRSTNPPNIEAITNRPKCCSGRLR